MQSPPPRRKNIFFEIKVLPLILVVVSGVLLSACSSSSRVEETSARGGDAGAYEAQARNQDQKKTRRFAGRSAIADIFSTDEHGDDDVVPYALEHNSVWQRIRNGGLELGKGQTNRAIEQELNWYRQRPAFIYSATERSERYLHYVVSQVEQRNLPMELALLPIVESSYDPFAYSRSGAAGIWQFMPATGKGFGLKQNWWYDGRRDVMASTDAALRYLEYLHGLFDGDWLLAVAAYNFGEGNLAKAIEANRKRGRPTDFWSLDLREETRAYVPKLLALARLVQSPSRHGISLHPIPDRAYFAAVEVPGQVALSRAATLAGVTEEEMRHLNPGFHHGATDPSGPHRLLVPVDKVERFQRQLAQAPLRRPNTGAGYLVVKGDTLSGIARRHGVSVDALQSANGIQGSNIRIGQRLAIPGSGDAEPVAVASGSRQLFHTVTAGENPRRIAARYGVTAADVMRWNGMRDGDYVRVGQRLSIWTNGNPPASALAAVADGRKFGYTVQRGDSLYGIATRFKVQVRDIVRWNQMSGEILHPGQRLTLYLADASGN
jgi:membrane-bound lytic murein transglycosylase D